MNRSFLIVGIILISIVSIQCKPANDATNTGKTETKQESPILAKIKAGALIVDVRTPGEFSGGHYKGAINIPVSQVESRMSEFGAKNKSIIVYCAVGARAGAAKRMLENAGYTDVINAISQRHMPVGN